MTDVKAKALNSLVDKLRKTFLSGNVEGRNLRQSALAELELTVETIARFTE